MQSDIVDYRNGKFQGPLNSHQQPHGLGIFIDDDLAFHISHWHHNQLSGPTLLYLTHGKYMYGEWKKNQPHGLNVYRSGDTVLLSSFKQGLPSERCLLIFETHNFACVLVEDNGEWEVSECGSIGNHQALISFIERVGLTVPDYYFSLTKFACSFSHLNKAIKIFPCQANNCYFGYVNGLAIVFNPNNGVVSVGNHRSQTLSQFGGRFEGSRKAHEGNFEPGGQTISYSGQRPATQIYSIFQQLHKKALNFHNHYLDSKCKVFEAIEAMLRGKLKEIAEEGMKREQLAHLNLNDSLDFHDYNEEQSLRKLQNREKMYSPPKRSMQGSTHKTSRTEFGNSSTSKPKHNQSKGFLTTAVSKDFGQGQPAESGRKSKESNFPVKEPGLLRHQRSAVIEDLQKQNIVCEKKPRSPYKFKNIEIPNFRDSNHYKKQEFSCYGQKFDASWKDQDERKDRNIPRTEYCRDPLLEKKPTEKESLLPRSRREEGANQRSPTFKGLIEQMENKYKLKLQEQPDSKIQIISSQKQHKVGQIHKPTRHADNIDEQSVKPRSSTQEKGKKFDINAVPRPTYEEIEERRKRVLRDFKELNNANPPLNHIQVAPQQDGMTRNPVPKRRRESQESNFAYVPLSISNKQIQLTPQKSEITKGRSLHAEKKIISQAQTPIREKASKQQANAGKEKRLRTVNDENWEAGLRKGEERGKKVMEAPEGGEGGKVNAASSQQNSVSPSRQKRTYVYLFE